MKDLSRFPNADLEVWLLLAVEAQSYRVQKVVRVINLQDFSQTSMSRAVDFGQRDQSSPLASFATPPKSER